MAADEFQAFLRAVLPGLGYNWRRFDRRNVRRRLRTRMESLGMHDWTAYARLIASDAGELERMDSLLRVTITRFFRNAWLWSELEVLITRIAASIGPGNPLRVWSAGCAGGEEAFSTAMLMDDLARRGSLGGRWSVLGTDTDQASLGRAREAAYSWGSVREVPEHLRERWFTETDGRWFLDEALRRSVQFKEHNLLTGRPPGRFNLVFLRNSILTYNTDDVQKEVLDRVRTCLMEPGYLVIGRTERVPEGAGFEEVSRCIYRKSLS